MDNKQYLLYRIYYDNTIVYVGRTNQPLQNRIRGHIFNHPMHRSIDINKVSKIEYTKVKSEADRNVYEIYYINLWKPILNKDDKCEDKLTLLLPDLSWNEFQTNLWSKWVKEVNEIDIDFARIKDRNKEIQKEIQELRRKKIAKSIPDDIFYEKYEKLKNEEINNCKKMKKYY